MDTNERIELNMEQLNTGFLIDESHSEPQMDNLWFLRVASYINISVYLCSSVVSFFLTTDGHRWTRIIFNH
ncbi:MAG: hypothetical protein CR997_13375 [Acidobacteria bacterium]|nr:MAG: hypothetical protein CR997_13375 [Acidobacteriota bacterium]